MRKQIFGLQWSQFHGLKLMSLSSQSSVHPRSVLLTASVVAEEKKKTAIESQDFHTNSDDPRSPQIIASDNTDPMTTQTVQTEKQTVLSVARRCVSFGSLLLVIR